MAATMPDAAGQRIFRIYWAERSGAWGASYKFSIFKVSFYAMFNFLWENYFLCENLYRVFFQPSTALGKFFYF
jgi:hypothetical protein